MHSEVFGNVLDKVMALHGPGFTTAFFVQGRMQLSVQQLLSTPTSQMNLS